MEGKYHYKSMFFFNRPRIVECRLQGARRVYPIIWTAGRKGYPVVNATYKIKSNF